MKKLLIAAMMMLAFAFVMMLVSPAFAQSPIVLPAVGAISTLNVVIMVASILLGVVSTALNTGKVLGRITVSPQVLVWLAIVAPFLGGAIGYLKTATDITAQVVLYAVLQGLLDVALGATPSATVAFAVHAHITLPQRLNALRASFAKALPANTNATTTPPTAPPPAAAA